MLQRRTAGTAAMGEITVGEANQNFSRVIAAAERRRP
jgi:hypothetical protein